MRRNLLLWVGILLAPIVWFLSMLANFALAPWACAFQWKFALFLVTIVALALCAISGFTAWHEWNQVGREMPGEGGGAVPRERYMALFGVLLSAFFFVVVLAQAVPHIILGACE
jgi:hypothetical protein